MTADPVQELMHRHHDLCARAVDPLEIAAGLEAEGFTDRMAAVRFRHRDVFSLADEMYVRAPHTTAPHDVTCEQAPRPAPPGEPVRRLTPAGALAHLLPGLLCTAVLLAPPGPAWRAALGAPLAVAAVVVALRCGPLRAPGAVGPVLWALALLGTAVHGEAAAVALAASLAPAALCARFFAVRARARLATACGLDDFAADARPLLIGALALYALALLALLAGARVLGRTALAGAAPPWPPLRAVVPAGPPPSAFAECLALGVLLFTARLLAVHGRRAAASAAVWAALAAEAAAWAAPHLAGPPLGAVAAASALACLVHAYRALPRATAHHRTYA